MRDFILSNPTLLNLAGRALRRDLAAETSHCLGSQARLEAMPADCYEAFSGRAAMEDVLTIEAPRLVSRLPLDAPIFLSKRFLRDDELFILSPDAPLVDLSDNNLTLKAPLNLSKAHTVDLSLNNIGERVRHLYIPIADTVNLAAINLGSAGVRDLKIPQAHTINLRANHIGDVGVRDMYVPQAHTIDLSFNGIGPFGARDLQLPQAHTVNLSHNHIGDEGARDLYVPQAHTIDLSSNHIGDTGVRDLKLPQAHTVNLSHNHIGDEGARDLKLPQAQIIRLRGNAISLAARGALERANPQTTFEW